MLNKFDTPHRSLTHESQFIVYFMLFYVIVILSWICVFNSFYFISSQSRSSYFSSVFIYKEFTFSLAFISLIC